MDRRDFVKQTLVGISALTASGFQCAAEDKQEDILYLLTYDHGGVVLWGKEVFLERLLNAVEWLDKYPGFKIGLDNEAYTYDELARSAPEVLEKLQSILKKYPKRFGIGTCTYGQPLSVFINEESNIRQIGYALEADREHLGCAPDIYIMSEHAMHSQIPQIINGFGFKGSIMRTHFMMYGYNPTFDVPIGWWIGVDGSRIPAIPTYNGEGARFGSTTVDNWFLTRYPGPEASKSMEDFRREFTRIKPLFATRADDAVLRKEDLVKETETKPNCHWLLLEDILSSFPAPEEDLKTKPNDFKVRMPWGYCGNEIWNNSRKAEIAVLTAERLAAMELMLGGNDHEIELRQAWKNLLVAQHHDIQICGLLDEARKFLPASISVSTKVINESLRFVASKMSGGENSQITVFNPNSWIRDEWIETEIALPRHQDEFTVMQGKKVIPSVLLDFDTNAGDENRIARVVMKASVPGLGFSSYSIIPKKEDREKLPSKISVDTEKLEIQTPYLKLRLNPEGGISGLATKAGVEILQTGNRGGFFAGKIDGVDQESKGKWSIEPAKDGMPWVIAKETGVIDKIPYTFELTLREDSPRIDCKVKFRFDGQKIGHLSEDKRDNTSGFIHEDKLRFKLFPRLEKEATGIRDLPFVISETKDKYVEGIYWTAVSDGKTGLACFNRGTMGSVREEDGGFSIPLSFAMYYVWGTRMLTGAFSYEFALYPFTGAWAGADLHRQALNYNYPLVAVNTEPGNQGQGNQLQLIDVPSDDVIVSAVYSEKKKIVARMYNHRDTKSQVQPVINLDIRNVVETDLAGNIKQKNEGAMDFAPWQIRTICFE